MVVGHPSAEAMVPRAALCRNHCRRLQREGLLFDGVVEPMAPPLRDVVERCDVAVLGAGVAGLCAARDLTLAGWRHRPRSA